MGVDADCSKDIGMRFGHPDRGMIAFHRSPGSNGHHRGNAGVRSAGKHGITIVVEGCHVEMAVRVDETLPAG